MRRADGACGEDDFVAARLEGLAAAFDEDAGRPRSLECDAVGEAAGLDGQVEAVAGLR